MNQGDSILDLRPAFEGLLQALRDACLAHYGERLISLAVYGSVGRGTMRADSDVDCLVVASPLPQGRLPRVEEFAPVERRLDAMIKGLRKRGINTYLTAVFRTPDEIRARSPLMLDMTQDARMLFDRDGFLRTELEKLAQRLRELGAKRVFKGDAWWWDLKPDFKPGDVIVI
jgi:predicted nucleotidyltransferase